MLLHKVISGGQTGADQTAIICAKELGLETGGTAPKNYRTEKGSEKWLKGYGLTESPYYDYAARTRKNVKDAECTVWIGNVGSPGYWCTRNAASEKMHNRPFFENPTPEVMRSLAMSYKVINFAGNRESTNPDVVQLTKDTFAALKEQKNDNQ